MPAQPIDADEDEFVEFKVRLDLATVAWACALADELHAPPAVVLASLIRDVRVDDEMAHDGARPRQGDRTH